MKSIFAAAVASVFLLGQPAGAETLKVSIESARPDVDPFVPGSVIMIQLKPDSTVAFEAFTTARVGETIDIRMGGKSILKPIIREPIKAGTLMISGKLTQDEAREMALGMTADGAFLEIDGSDK